MPSHLDFIFRSIFHPFLLPTSIPWTLKVMVFPKEKQGFFQKIAFRSWHRFLFDFSANMPLFLVWKFIKILLKIDSKMYHFFDRFLHGFLEGQEGAKTAKMAPRRRQDCPRGRQDRSKRVKKTGVFFLIFRSWPPRRPKSLPRPLQDWFLTNFRLIFGGFSVSSWSIFG